MSNDPTLGTAIHNRIGGALVKLTAPIFFAAAAGTAIAGTVRLIADSQDPGGAIHVLSDAGLFLIIALLSRKVDRMEQRLFDAERKPK